MSTNFIEYQRDTIDENIVIKEDLKTKTLDFIWRIKFSAPLDPETVNNINMYVTSSKNVPLKTSIKYDSILHSIEIKPLAEYIPGETYILTITNTTTCATLRIIRVPTN